MAEIPRTEVGDIDNDMFGPLTTGTKHYMLDKEGDVLIRTSTCEFLVASKILSMASPVFKALLSPSFAEGQHLRSASNPLELDLMEDNSSALKTVLRILHFWSVEGHITITQLYEVTKLSDKYDLIGLMKYHISCWAQVVYSADHLENLEKLLLIALLCRYVNAFKKVSKEWISRINKYTCFSGLELNLLEETREAFQLRREDLVATMIAATDRTILTLCEKQGDHGMSKKLRSSCRKQKPLATRKCGYCGSVEFEAIICDGASRVRMFIEELDSIQMYPLVNQRGRSPSDYLKQMKHFCGSHNCEGEEMCPLLRVKSILRKELEAAMQTNTGLDMELS